MFKLLVANELTLVDEAHRAHLCSLRSADVADRGIVLDDAAGDEMIQLQ